MTTSSITVVDVGHGNCSVLRDNGRVALFDAGHKVHVVEYLRSEKITDIDLVVISHSDADHLEGLVALLGTFEFRIRKIVVKPDSTKDSKLWNDFCTLVDALSRKGDITVSNDPDFSEWNVFADGAQLEFVAPSLYLALKGPGGEYAPEGDPIGTVTNNSSSIVIRVLFNNSPMVLITGDMDQIALDDIEHKNRNISAHILVFPHHGGRPGVASIERFTEKLLRMVAPKYVLFSIGRGRYDTPRPEILSQMHKGFAEVHALCTQLSLHCCAHDQMLEDVRSFHKYSGGSDNKMCCSGTIEIDLASGIIVHPNIDDHSKFIAMLPSPLCFFAAH